MTNLTKIGLIAALAAGIALTGQAQEDQQKKQGPRGPRMSVEQRVERLDKELTLTADQKTKITAELEKENKARQDIFQNSSLTREERRQKMQGLNEEQTKAFKGILTPEQFTKWDKMREQMREQMRDRRPPGGEGKDQKKDDKKKDQ